MSDDLVKRLLDWSEHDEGKINDARQEAADRIEQSEEKLRARTAERNHANDVTDAAIEEVNRLKALLAKAVEALKHAKLNMPHPDQMVDDTLAEIEGSNAP